MRSPSSKGVLLASANGSPSLTPSTSSTSVSLLRPTVVKDARPGTYRILTSDNGITDNGLKLDVIPARYAPCFSFDIIGNSLYVTYRPMPTLFLVR